jgi:hypothetical protein
VFQQHRYAQFYRNGTPNHAILRDLAGDSSHSGFPRPVSFSKPAFTLPIYIIIPTHCAFFARMAFNFFSRRFRLASSPACVSKM